MRVAVVGATGAVGTLLLALLERRGFPADEVVPFASARSAGRQLGDMVVQPLTDETIQGFDVALFSAGGATSREWSPRFAAAGALVVDNSSAWRMDPEVPLVVTEVNPDALEHIGKGIVANPNCTTMAVMLPAKALHDAFGLTTMVCPSFQAAGGAGQKGMDELHAQVERVREHDLVNDGAAAAASVEAKVHAKALAFNVVPWLGAQVEGGYSDEEMKLRNESRKILDLPGLNAAPTCVRVPVMVGHAIEVRAPFERPVDLDEAMRALGAFPNLELDDIPTPLEWAGRDEVAVGSVRADLFDDHSLNFFVVGDNLLKGAALNTVQIAELLHARGLVGGAACPSRPRDVAAGSFAAMGERTSYPPGTFSWVDLQTSDPEAAKAFYSSLLGWDYEDIPIGDGAAYSMARLQDHSVAAIGPLQGEGMPSHWNCYVTVADVDASAARAAELGATLLAEPFDVFDAGRMAAFQDPQGAVLSIWQAKDNIGA